MNRQEGAGGLLGRAPRSPVVPGVVQRNTLDCCCYKKGWSVGGDCDGAEKHTGLDWDVVVGSLKRNFALWPQSSDNYWEVFQGRQKTGRKKGRRAMTMQPRV